MKGQVEDYLNRKNMREEWKSICYYPDISRVSFIIFTINAGQNLLAVDYSEGFTAEVLINRRNYDNL